MMLFDVDGVLTDGKILLHADGTESKQFDIRDGTGLVWAQKAGLRVGLLSARASVSTTQRATQLGISLVRQGDASKLRAYDDILQQHGYEDADVAYMGDDVLDVPIIERVGLSACPADASQDVRSRVDYVCRSEGGNGAARELIELVLKTQDRWQALLAGHAAKPSKTTRASTGRPRVTRFPPTESRRGKS
jgi:3-deoxy-D-manno-octulosonate 8-phosphate phosphatase (KDO 8-P phosphatase)